MVKANTTPEIDMSIQSWLFNTQTVLQFPLTIIIVLSLIVTGTFVEIAPRKSLEFMDNTIGTIVFFTVPLILALSLDWATGLLAAVVSLIVFTRLKKIDVDEGFVDSSDEGGASDTKIVSNPHRWFVEKMLGEHPVAISSDRVITRAVEEDANRKSSGISTSTNASSSVFSNFNSSSSNK